MRLKNISMELFELMEFLVSNKPKEVLKEKLKFVLNNSNENQKYCILKILTGELSWSFSWIDKDSLALFGNRKIEEIEEFWHGFKLPYTDFLSG